MKRNKQGKFSPSPVSDRIRRLVRVDADTSCWLWQGHIGHGGYPLVKDGQRRTRRASRLSFETFVGPIPEGKQVDHICNVRSCVNPEHLQALTPRENVLRSELAPAAVNARKAECIHGHPFTEDNTWVDKKGSRHCRICDRRRSREKRARRKLAASQQAVDPKNTTTNRPTRPHRRKREQEWESSASPRCTPAAGSSSPPNTTAT